MSNERINAEGKKEYLYDIKFNGATDEQLGTVWSELSAEEVTVQIRHSWAVPIRCQLATNE